MTGTRQRRSIFRHELLHRRKSRLRPAKKVDLHVRGLHARNGGRVFNECHDGQHVHRLRCRGRRTPLPVRFAQLDGDPVINKTISLMIALFQ